MVSLSYLILACERRDGVRAVVGARAEGREVACEPTEPRVHGRWIVQLMRMSLETYAELEGLLLNTVLGLLYVLYINRNS